MNKLNAFVGHSFDENDEAIIRVFLDYFGTLKDVGLEWEHAERAEPKVLSEKVREKMEGKNVFIGIFTIKHRQILGSKLKSGRFNKSKLTGMKNDFQWSTSDWIIQESGYALGKGMKLLSLAEKGLSSIGGLQGDLEFIPFSRENPSQCFPKLNEMITALMKGTHETVITEGIKEKPSIQPVEYREESEAEEEKKGLLFDLISAIKKGDFNKEIELKKKYIEETAKGNKDKEVESLSFYYWLSYTFGGRDELENLRKLSKENPEHNVPYIWLGNLYLEYKNFDDAADAYLKAENYSKEASDKTTYLCKAANALLKANKNNYARKLLLGGIAERSNFPSELHGLYKELAEIFLEGEALEQYFSFAEKALELHPSDKDLRFNVASTYYKNKKHAQSLYHYKILCSTSPDAGNWNNLGVEYSELSMAGKAVSAYKRSEEKGGSIAIGNIAQKLINEGFLDDAQKKIEEALKKSEYDPTIPKALARIEEVRNSEEEKEKETLSSIVSEQQFRIDYADAYTISHKIESLSLKWKSKYGEVEVLIRDDKFSAKGEIDMPPSGLAAIYNPYRRSESKQDMLKKIISYSGKVINRAIDYTLTVKTVPVEEYDKTSIGGLALTENVRAYTGQMILDKECKKIFVMEKDSKDNVSFYEMTALE